MLRRVSHVWEWRINVSVIEAAGADSSLFLSAWEILHAAVVPAIPTPLAFDSAHASE